MNEEVLTGGGLNQVVRVGATVRRPVGPWTPRVHELLRRLAPLGVVPKVRGFDEQGREMLDFLPGEVGHPPIAEHLRGDETLVAVARLIRRMHDASVDLVDRRGWQFDPIEPIEVIVHGDLAPYNMVFHGDQPIGVIDFDTARPGPRWWDVAYAVYCLAPFSTEFGTPQEQGRRGALFCAEYGCSNEDLVDHVLARLHDMVRMIREDPAFRRQRTEQHDEYYLAQVRYVETHRAELAYR